MRVAVVSDIHGNRTAFEAVLADLRDSAPDLILHGGDLADSGAGPVEVVDWIRDLGWQGVVGNTDEMLFRPESLEEFSAGSPGLQPVFMAVAEMAVFTRELLGDERLARLRDLPIVQIHERMSLVHASPENLWRAPAPEAGDAELATVYGGLGQSIVVYGHIHRPFIRSIGGMTVSNTGSVGLPYDGDRRASYLLLDDGKPAIRRVEYDIEKELSAVAVSGLPHADWVGRMLASGRPQMP